MGELVRVKVDAPGRVVVPKELREALGIPDGGELTLSVQDGELRGLTRMAALRKLQADLRSRRKPDDTGSVVDELIADRRAEVERERAEDEAWEAEQRARSAGF